MSDSDQVYCTTCLRNLLRKHQFHYRRLEQLVPDNTTVLSHFSITAELDKVLRPLYTPETAASMADSGSSDPLSPRMLPDKEGAPPGHITERAPPEIGESSRAAGKRPFPREGTADQAVEQIENVTGVRKSSNSIGYTKSSYSRDCMTHLLIVKRMARRDPGYNMLFLHGTTNSTDVGAAQAIYRLSSDSKRKILQTEADQSLLSIEFLSFILKSRETFQAWLTRFREGPGEPGELDLSPEAIEEVTQSRRPSPVPTRRPSPGYSRRPSPIHGLRPSSPDRTRSRPQPRLANLTQEKQRSTNKNP